MESDINSSPNNSFEYSLQNEAGQEVKEQASWQLVQAVYHSITGKSEKIEIENEYPCQLDINKIKQLHYKIIQTAESYNIVGKNYSIIIFHKNDIKQEVSSFEKFDTYDTSNNNPIKRIQIKYNIFIHLPKVEKPQNYTLVINLLSGIIVEQEIADMHKRFPFNIEPLISYDTIRVEIGYVDYVVANNFQHVINDWIQTVSDNTKNKYLILLKPATLITKYILLILLTIAFVMMAPKIDIVQPVIFYQFLIITSLLLFFAYKFGKYVSIKIGRLILMKRLSYIDINEGDKKAIESEKKRRSHAILKGGLLPILQIIIGIGAFFF